LVEVKSPPLLLQSTCLHSRRESRHHRPQFCKEERKKSSSSCSFVLGLHVKLGQKRETGRKKRPPRKDGATTVPRSRSDYTNHPRKDAKSIILGLRSRRTHRWLGRRRTHSSYSPEVAVGNFYTVRGNGSNLRSKLKKTARSTTSWHVACFAMRCVRWCRSMNGLITRHSSESGHSSEGALASLEHSSLSASERRVNIGVQNTSSGLEK